MVFHNLCLRFWFSSELVLRFFLTFLNGQTYLPSSFAFDACDDGFDFKFKRKRIAFDKT